MHIVTKLRKHVLLFYVCIALYVAQIKCLGEVIWAVNAGGESHTDVHGIQYQRDTNPAGVASDYGKNLIIQREGQQDQVLYQTERYDSDTFGYDIPIRRDGDYVLVLKFSEVWFTAPGQKVFDVQLNGMHTIVENLDIFSKVGRGVAHDEIIPFTVKKGEIVINGEKSSLESNRMRVEFVKGDHDNPKVNAMYVMRGSVSDVPKLPPLPGFDRQQQPPHGDFGHGDELDEDEYEDDGGRGQPPRKRPSSGPRVQDPYATDDTSSMMLPVLVAIGLFVPLVFCLCKL